MSQDSDTKITQLNDTQYTRKYKCVKHCKECPDFIMGMYNLTHCTNPTPTEDTCILLKTR